MELFGGPETRLVGNPSTATTIPLLERSPSFAPQTATLSGKAVSHELAWRVRPVVEAERPSPKIEFNRWRRPGVQPSWHSARCDASIFTVGITLRPMNFSLSVDGRVVHDGRLSSGAVHVTEPGSFAQMELRGPADFLHLFVPRSVFASFADPTELAGAPTFWGGAQPLQDWVIERLAVSLLDAPGNDGRVGEIYKDGITSAIAARLLSRSRERVASSALTHRGLAKWRLKRVIEYVDLNLSETIRLDDMAGCAGLSRMHFAAQFKAATGLRPHEYVVRKRVERAQEMLRFSSISLVEVALSVGFQTQAHFTTTFRERTLKTPGQWRQFCQQNL